MSLLSVIIPTWECAGAIPAHLESVRQWQDLAEEIIVVDSESADGTAAAIRNGLDHPGLRIESRPRGLYQSWNHGIALTSGRWIYISTVGDTIERAHLERLIRVGEARGSDVVISPPAFRFENPEAWEEKVWPVAEIIREHGLAEPAEVSPEALLRHALQCLPESFLGSSASNLYRGDHLRARPFPVEFGVTGDTAWSLRHLFDTRFTFVPECGSVFLFHRKAYAKPDGAESLRIRGMMLDLAARALAAAPDPARCGWHREFLALERALHEANSFYRLGKRSHPFSWFARPALLRARAERDRLRRLKSAMLAAPGFPPC